MRLVSAAAAALAVCGAAQFPRAQSGVSGLQDPAWAPDGRHVAVSYLDRIWTMAPDGRQARALTADTFLVEREPAWSPDGTRIAFAATTGAGFDIHVVSARGGTSVAVTSLAGDERWPSWTPDGRIVFAHREDATGRVTDPGRQWDLFVVSPVAGSPAWQAPLPLTTTSDNETYPRVAPNGRRVAFVSDRESPDDVDLWAMPVPDVKVARPVPLGRRPPERAGSPTAGEPMDARTVEGRPPRVVRVTRARGEEAAPSWAPDSERLAFYAVRDNVGSVWVAHVDPPAREGSEPASPRPRPGAPPQLASRLGGVPAWSPDGATLLVAGLPDPQPVYNGNPLRSEGEPPALFAADRAFQLWQVPAPLPVHAAGGRLAPDLSPPPDLLASAFSRVWATLRDLYYQSGPAFARWNELRAKYQPRAVASRSEAELETVIDAMVAEQPLIKPVVTSRGAVIVAGHPLAAEAGRRAFEMGGNVVDAAVAVSFALGVVEPEASGIGGDGAAVLYLEGMRRPTVIDYKDQTPMRATLDNTAIMRDGRLVADGPAAANIPGVVAGLDYLYRTYGTGKVKWADLLEPAIRLADEGFVLDEALPTSLAEGRRYLEKYEEAARIYLPGGRVPRPGDRFINKDYASTLRAIARDGADTFYRGDIARKIAADMAANGGIIGYADLAQYRAIEREPIAGRYRGHALYAGGAPVSTGVQLFESLHVLDLYSPREGARIVSDADYFHYVLEAWKVRDPVRRVADPERWPVDYGDHLSADHAKTQFAKIDPKTAMRYERQPPEDAPAPSPRIGTGTTAFAVADADGNMIAVTQTLSTWGGTFYVSRGLGFLYNNHLRSTRTTAGAYGSLVPLMRSSTTSVPTLVFEQTAAGEVPRLAVACAGNAWIPVSVYSIILGVIDGQLGAQAAIEAPRFLPGRDPADPLEDGARIEIEDRFPRAIVEDLRSRGHRFLKIGRKGEVRYGYAAAIVVDAVNQQVEGGAEPRRSHAAVAVERRAATQHRPGPAH